MMYPRFLAPHAPINLPIQRCLVRREEASHRILIMRLGSYGDILMATPLLAALRASFPAAYITWMVEHSAQQAIDANPYVDEVLVWDGWFWKRMLKRWQFPQWLMSALRFRSELRQRNFDTFISYHAEQWPSLAWAVAGRQSIGVHGIFPQFDKPNEAYAKWYTDWFSRKDGLPLHHTDIYLLALKAMGLPPPTINMMSLGFTATDARAATHFLTESSRGRSSSGSLVVVAPRTTWETRCWSEDRYVELCDRLAAQHCRVVLVGTTSEQPYVEEIASRMQVRPAVSAGALAFRELAALLAQADLVVSGDTGPMHAAAAVGTPYIALFGPTPAEGRAPIAGYGRALFHSVPCGPCDLPTCHNAGENHMLCMRLLTVHEVLRAAEQLTSGFTATK